MSLEFVEKALAGFDAKIEEESGDTYEVTIETSAPMLNAIYEALEGEYRVRAHGNGVYLIYPEDE